MTFQKSLLLTTAALALASGIGSAFVVDSVMLTIDSWCPDDLPIWQDKILPVFMAAHPDIKVVFAPTASTEYNASLNTKLQGGSAADIITCRPFDASLALFKAGQLSDLTSLPGMENFNDTAKVAWSTDDGKQTFCVPMASVIHGFIYNKDALDNVTHDQWEAATMGYQNIGPNYWKGEEGRKALIAGTQKLTDPQWVAPYTELAKWKPYLADGIEAQTDSDS